MVARIKTSLAWVSELISLACCWAVGALALYALFFVDVPGNGRLWDQLHAVFESDSSPAPAAVRAYFVPAQAADHPSQEQQDRMLMAPRAGTNMLVVAVAAPARGYR